MNYSKSKIDNLKAKEFLLACQQNDFEHIASYFSSGFFDTPASNDEEIDINFISGKDLFEKGILIACKNDNHKVLFYLMNFVKNFSISKKFIFKCLNMTIDLKNEKSFNILYFRDTILNKVWNTDDYCHLLKRAFEQESYTIFCSIKNNPKNKPEAILKWFEKKSKYSESCKIIFNYTKNHIDFSNAIENKDMACLEKLAMILKFIM